MSVFTVDVIEIKEIQPHLSADKLEVLVHEGETFCVTKGKFQVGQKAVLVPCESMVPNKDPFKFLFKDDRPKIRIKAVRLRGVYSYGSIHTLEECGLSPDLEVGIDVKDLLDIQKYEEKEATFYNIKGSNCATTPKISYKYDVDKKRFGSFNEGEEVVVTAKIHGTNSRYLFSEDKMNVGSHGVWRKGPEDTWWDILKSFRIEDFCRAYPDHTLYGEIFGKGIQDLTYGLENHSFVAFDIMKPDRSFMDYDEFVTICNNYGIPVVPELFRGPFSPDLRELASGEAQPWFGGGKPHIQEGVVIKPVKERLDYRFNRVITKVISPEYLTRKNGTEYH